VSEAICCWAVLMLSRITSECRASVSPASVSRICRPTRTNSGVPTDRSRAFICWVIAGWV
jgi:hypothetical protein